MFYLRICQSYQTRIHETGIITLTYQNRNILSFFRGHQHHQLFSTQYGELESNQLPPCEDCLFMHAMRANYQAGIWRCSLQQHPQVPSPLEHSWARNDDGQLTVEWRRGFPVPEAVLKLLSCNCSRRCKLPECQCMSSGLKCTNLCKLQTCDNQPEEDDHDMITDADLTDSDTED